MKAMQHSISKISLAVVLLVAAAGSSVAQSIYTLGSGSYMGIYMTDLSDGTRRALGLEEGQGVLVEDIVEGEAADKAGILAGDVILEFDSRQVSSASDVGRLLNRQESGETVEVVVFRERKRVTLSMEMRQRRRPQLFVPSPDGVLPAVPAPSAPDVNWPAQMSYSFWGVPSADRALGIRIQELTGQLAEYFDVGRGLLVTWVVPNSPAGRAGVHAGDILVSLAGQPIVGEQDLTFILSAEDDAGEITLEVVRRGEKKTLTLEL
jgi:serine protease Do